VTDGRDDHPSEVHGDTRRIIDETFRSWSARPARLGPGRPIWQIITATVVLAGVVGAAFGAIGWRHDEGGAVGHAATGFVVAGGLVGTVILRVIAWEQRDDDRQRRRRRRRTH
jgi:hypothetical protein